MRKKPPVPPPLASPEPHGSALDRRNVRTKDLFLYARSFHVAATKLAGTLDCRSSPFPECDVSPVVFLYKHALELHLKAIVLGEGGNFLVTKPDSISVSKSHSVAWLAQFVCQIVTAVGWQEQCKYGGIGIENLADFKAAVDEMNAVDPGSYVFRSPVHSPSETTVRDFGQKMDAILDLLASTADALAAEWDLRSDTEPGKNWDGGGFEPTVH